MRRYAFILAALVALAPNGARAAGPLTADWSGVYFGLNAGGGWSSADWLNKTSTPAATCFDYTPGQGFSNGVSGVFGGAQLGINFQNGPWVFGLEAMLDGSSISGDFSSTSLFGAGDDQFKARLDALFLGTGRVGYSWNDWLAYGKAGYAAGKIHLSVSDTVAPTTGSGSASQWRSGPTVGLGIEYRLTPQFSVAAEYDYVRLNAGRYQLGGGAGSYIWDVGIRDVNLLMVRMNYRFALGR
jgi:outer membrane immunogenic protein